MTGQGPLAGVRVLEFAGIGPGPFCVQLLSDMGADVVRIERPRETPRPMRDPTGRGRVSLAVDVKSKEGQALAKAALAKADVLIEGYRPGVMERLGLGPDEALAINPRLIYGRMTGWGQEGPLAQAAGHDINYIALTGALASVGEPDRPPPPPLNLVGDFGGGALYLAFGIAAALFERERSGQGQVIDAAMVDGAASLMTMFYGLSAHNPSLVKRQFGALSGAQHYYRCYECADGRYVAVGAIEPQFRAELIERLGLPAETADAGEPAEWPGKIDALAQAFKRKTRDEWRAVLEGADACFAPVMEVEEAAGHPHMRARGTFVEVDGVVQPAPAPRFSRTPGRIQGPAPETGEGGAERLRAWGVEAG
jgi:alpha-methylacyl-CoA racemase